MNSNVEMNMNLYSACFIDSKFSSKAYKCFNYRTRNKLNLAGKILETKHSVRCYSRRVNL